MEQADLKNISVRLHWDSWQTVRVALPDLRELHWAQPPGAPRELLHASVSCASLPLGSLPHDCAGNSDHSLVVCILKAQTPAAIYEALECQAGLRGMGPASRTTRQTMMPLRTA